MRRLLLITSSLLLALVAMIPSAQGQGTWEQLDQAITVNPTHSQGLGGSTYAQTFTAGLSGLLTRVELYLYLGPSFTSSLTVEIRTTTPDGPTGNETPNSGTVLASTTIWEAERAANTPTSVPFATPPLIEAGEVYAIVVHTSGVGWLWSFSTTDYAGGKSYACRATNCSIEGEDLYAFRTYVGEPDPIGPTGTININDGAQYTNNRTVNLALTCSDNISGCASMAFSSDGTNFTTPVPIAAEATFMLPDSDGPQAVYARFTDQAGSSSVVSDTITLDRVAPDTTIISGPPAITSNHISRFEATSTEPGGRLECALDTGIGTPIFSECYSPIIMGIGSGSGADGTYTWWMRKVDAAGNVDPSPAGWTWTIDQTAPDVTINRASGQPDLTMASTVTYTVEFSEPVSGFDVADLNIVRDPGLSVPTVSIDPATGPASTYTVTLSNLIGDGDISLTISAGAARDVVNHASTASTSTDNTITIDQTAPITIASITEAPGQDDWYQTATITLSPDGPATTMYSINGTPAQTYTGPFSLTTDGIHTITFGSVDSVGNEENDRTLAVKVDGTAPVFTQPLGDQTLDPTGPDGAQVFFSPTVIDALSSASGITATCVDQFNNPFTSGDFAPIGTTTITCTATDLAGNSASESFTVTVRSVGSLWEELRAMIVALDLASSTERTLLTQATIGEAFSNAGQPGMACLQLSALDMSVKSQESKRRVSRQDAAAIYAQTQQIRNVIGCGGTPS